MTDEELNKLRNPANPGHTITVSSLISRIDAQQKQIAKLKQLLFELRHPSLSIVKRASVRSDIDDVLSE